MCRQRLQNRRSARARGEVSKSLPLVPPEASRSVREPDPECCYVCLGAVSTDENPIFFCHRCPSVNGPVNGVHYNCAKQNKLPVPATASGVSDEVFLWSCFKCEQPAPAVPVKSVLTPYYLCNAVHFTIENLIFACHRCVSGVHYSCLNGMQLPVPATASGVNDEACLWECGRCEQRSPGVSVKLLSGEISAHAI